MARDFWRIIMQVKRMKLWKVRIGSAAGYPFDELVVGNNSDEVRDAVGDMLKKESPGFFAGSITFQTHVLTFVD
jgi:hypothetical protein